MIPRNEYPNPQAERAEWMNLNGEWEFEIDAGVSGAARRLFEKEHLDGKIIVPFCPESKLSGVEHKDFMNCVWYRRDIEIPAEWQGGRVILHFGAVDHTATVYLNGKQVGTHQGGFVSFEIDVTAALVPGVNSLCVCAVDDHRNPLYGHGKQSYKFASSGCHYTRVTGIWQTVWLEHVPDAYIGSFRLTPDIYNQTLTVEAEIRGAICGANRGAGTLTAEAFYEGKPMGTLTLKAPYGGKVSGVMALSELHLWELGNGRLYTLKLTCGEDVVSSYFGMRDVRMNGYQFLLNGKSVYQRLVLDQGFYPDGVYTAPDDAALIRDIELSMSVGFNGARLHQKVFEPRFLYHCDRLGYMVWGEYGNWGIDYSDYAAIPPLQAEWREVLARDYNHPAIVGWCPLNETWDYNGRKQKNEMVSGIYYQTVTYDPTRPCIDTSGNYHVVTDLFDIHDYIQEPEKFGIPYRAATAEECMDLYEKSHSTASKHQCPYLPGQPVFVSEYGGIKWDVNSQLSNAWGYGNAPKTKEEFLKRYQDLTNILLDCPYCCGFCYTQLYDVEQEVNGLYTYDRQPKFDAAFFHAVNTRRAAIED